MSLIVDAKTSQDSIVNSSLQYVLRHGLKDLSLRTLSAGINTSARMLVHYFGSSKGLFDRIINEFVRREMTRATALTDKALQQENSLLAFVEAYVTALVRPQASGLVGTLFEVYGITILGSDVAKDSLDTLLSHWLLQIDRVLKKQELDSTLQLQTVVMAACNGFVLDQLATSQKERIKLSIEAFVTNCVASNSRQLANANKI